MRLNEAGLDEYFSAVVTYEEQESKNPQKSRFCEFVMSLRLSRRMSHGRRLARTRRARREISGMKTCLATYGQVRPGKADYQIESFANLLDVVDRCSKKMKECFGSPLCFKL